MGFSVIDPDGGSPAEKWRMRVGLLDRHLLAPFSEALLSGESVIASDDGVQVACLSHDDTSCVLRIRDGNPAITHSLELYVEALTAAEIESSSAPDPAGEARPVPDAWRTTLSETADLWELYNCRVVSVWPRRCSL